MNKGLMKEVYGNILSIEEQFPSGSYGALSKYYEELSKLNAEEAKFVDASLKAGHSAEQFGNSLSVTAKSAKAASIALNVLTTAAIVAAITVAIQALDYLIHYEEKVKEKADAARDSIKSFNDELKKGKETTDQIKTRYAELAQQVSNLGTAFQSQGTLSTDEYTEFLNLSNQLAELYPTLTKGYDDNGNAILNLSGNVNTIVSSLDALIDRSNILAHQQMKEKMPDIWKDNLFTIENNIGKVEDYTDRFEVYTKLLEKFNNEYYNGKRFSTPEFGNREWVALSGIMTGKAYDQKFDNAQRWRDDGMATYSFGVLTEAEKADLADSIREQIEYWKGLMKEAEAKVEQVNTEMQSHLFEWMSGDVRYLKLDKNQQKMVNEILSNFDMSMLPNDVKSWDDLTAFYDRYIIGAIEDIDSNEIQVAMANVLSNSLSTKDLSKAYQDIINALREKYGDNLQEGDAGYDFVLYWTTKYKESEDNKKALLSHLFGIDSNDNRALQYYIDTYGDFIDNLNPDQIKDLMNLEIDMTGLDTVEEKIEYLESLLNGVPNEKDIKVNATISESVKQLATQMDPYMDEIGSFYQKIFAEGYNSLDKSVLDNDTLNSLRSTFEEIADEVGVTFDPQIVDDFWHELESSENADAAHEAINKFATEWLNATDTIKNINDDTARYVQTQLENWGVVNADKVVQSRLDINKAESEAKAIYEETIPLYEQLREAQKALNSESLLERNEARAKISQIERLIASRYQEIEMTEATRIALFKLALQEAGMSFDNIDTSSDVAQILEIATACGITSKALSALQEFESGIAKLGANGMDTKAMESMKQMLINQFKAEMDPAKLMEDIVLDLPQVAGGAGKEAGEELVDEFTRELEILQKLRDNDVIDTKTYLDQERLLIQKFYANNTLSAEQYFEKMHAWLREMLDFYNSVISDVTKLLDKEISKLEEERKERLESIEKEKKAALEAVDEEIDALDKRIKKKNEEIEALEREHEQRKKNMDMARAQYNLMRSLYQRVNLVDLCQAS